MGNSRVKGRGLKQLFKLIASTTYEHLVQSFYENLKYNCNRPGVLFSSIDNKDVEVTIVDIAAALKCHAEPPEAEEPWIVCDHTKFGTLNRTNRSSYSVA
jgi:hypothetical protein